MGTGVISLGLTAAGWQPVSLIFLGIAVAGYLELLLVEGRLVVLRPSSLPDTFSSLRGALGAFSFAVATLVLASRFTALGDIPLAIGLFVIGGAAAVICSYLVPISVFLRPFEAGRLRIGGGMWLLWPVALDATSVAASSISRTGHVAPGPLAVLAAATWTLGLALYLPLLAALLGSLVLTDIHLREVGPSYWITMGAAALSCLAASYIAANPATKAFVNPGFATTASQAGLGLWFLATALLPAVCGLSAARTLRRGLLVGSPKELWLPVFPMAMYALATRTLGLTTHVSWLAKLGGDAVWLGVAVFLIEVLRAVQRVLLPES
jgi:hypothetical protein